MKCSGCKKENLTKEDFYWRDRESKSLVYETCKKCTSLRNKRNKIGTGKKGYFDIDTFQKDFKY